MQIEKGKKEKKMETQNREWRKAADCNSPFLKITLNNLYQIVQIFFLIQAMNIILSYSIYSILCFDHGWQQELEKRS